MNMTIWKSKAESRTLSEQFSVCCVLLLRRQNLCKTGSSSETDDAGIPRCPLCTGGGLTLRHRYIQRNIMSYSHCGYVDLAFNAMFI